MINFVYLKTRACYPSPSTHQKKKMKKNIGPKLLWFFADVPNLCLNRIPNIIP